MPDVAPSATPAPAPIIEMPNPAPAPVVQPTAPAPDIAPVVVPGESLNKFPWRIVLISTAILAGAIWFAYKKSKAPVTS
jgi:hypothetical protein